MLSFHSDVRLMIRHAASLLDAKDPGATMAAAMAKKTATDIGFQVTTPSLRSSIYDRLFSGVLRTGVDLLPGPSGGG